MSFQEIAGASGLQDGLLQSGLAWKRQWQEHAGTRVVNPSSTIINQYMDIWWYCISWEIAIDSDCQHGIIHETIIDNMDIFYNTGVNYIYILCWLLIYFFMDVNHIIIYVMILGTGIHWWTHDFYRLHVGRYLEHGKCNIDWWVWSWIMSDTRRKSTKCAKCACLEWASRSVFRALDHCA